VVQRLIDPGAHIPRKNTRVLPEGVAFERLGIDDEMMGEVMFMNVQDFLDLGRNERKSV